MLSSATFYVTAILLRYTKICIKLQTTSPESKFHDEYSGVIFIQINQQFYELQYTKCI